MRYLEEHISVLEHSGCGWPHEQANAGTATSIAQLDIGSKFEAMALGPCHEPRQSACDSITPCHSTMFQP